MRQALITVDRADRQTEDRISAWNRWTDRDDHTVSSYRSRRIARMRVFGFTCSLIVTLCFITFAITSHGLDVNASTPRLSRFAAAMSSHNAGSKAPPIHVATVNV